MDDLQLPSEDIDYDRETAKDRTPDEDEQERARRKKLHEECIAAYKASADHFSEQRVWDSLWRRFYRAIEPSDQWDKAVLDHRKGGTQVNGITSTEKPCLTMNEIKQPIQQGINEARQAQLGLYVKPERGDASRREADTRQGILRGIQYHSNSVAAHLWALESAFITGRGFWRIDKQYTGDGDDEIDLTIGLILHQDSVYPDPTSTQLDLSDATDGCIVDRLSHQEFRRRFPNAKEPAPDDQQLEALGEYSPQWANDKTWGIGERYYVVQKFKVVFRDLEGMWQTIPDPEAEPDEDGEIPPRLFDAKDLGSADDVTALLPEGVERWRKVPVRTIKYCLYSASDILEEGEWEGDYIPIVQTVGRVHVVDGKVYYKGLVADGMSPQQLINYGISSLAMQVGIGSTAPWIVDPEQIEQFADMWSAANTENFAALFYSRFVDGQDYGQPKRDTTEPPILATLSLFTQARDLLKAATGRFGASLGDISPDRSGKAINALKVQGEMGSSDFMDNLANLALVQESRVLNSMMYPVYGHAGRLVKILGDTDEDEEAGLINQPFMVDPDGRPQPAPPPGPPPGMMQQMGQSIVGGIGRMMGQPPAPPPEPPEVKEWRLTRRGQYAVRWTVGKAQSTQREENVALLQGVLEAVGKVDPNITRAVAIALVKNLDGPAAKELADQLSTKGPNGEDVPPALQAMMAQLQQQRDEAAQAAQQAMAQLKGKEMELARDERLKAAEIQSRHAIEAQRLKVELAKLDAMTQGKVDLEALKASQAQLEQMADHQHEREMQATEIAAERAQQEREIAAEAEAQARQAEIAEENRRAAVHDARVDKAMEPEEPK